MSSFDQILPRLPQHGEWEKTIYVRGVDPAGKRGQVWLRTEQGTEKIDTDFATAEQAMNGLDAGARQYFRDQWQKAQNPVGSYAGLTVTDRTLVMGIVNVTPDSFSDGGDHAHASAAIAHAHKLLEEGADILDIGGESTRPGAPAVGLQEELDRVIPVIEGLKGCGAKISIDTRNAPVMAAAIAAGAHIINDVTGLEGDGSVKVAVDSQVPVMIMHMQGEPQTMQANPTYQDCVLDIYDYLSERIQTCVAAGIKMENICVDPGVGFGKTLDHNAQIMKYLDMYHGLGCNVLLGASRKSFIEKICPGVAAKDRLAGSLTAAIFGAQNKAQIVRVHDVAETCQALDVWATLNAQ